MAKVVAPAPRDAGLTLVELVVAMFVFSIVSAVFLTSVIGLIRATSDAEARSRSATGIVLITQQLDRQVRYADSINFPGVGPSGARYIEFRTPAASSRTGVTECTQWRFLPDEGRIESRTWADAASPTLPAFTTRMTEVVDEGGLTYPFRMIPASPTDSLSQRLQITIVAGSERTGSRSELAFVARNSSVLSPGNRDANSDGVSDAPFVCRPAGSRP